MNVKSEFECRQATLGSERGYVPNYSRQCIREISSTTSWTGYLWTRSWNLSAVRPLSDPREDMYPIILDSAYAKYPWRLPECLGHCPPPSRNIGLRRINYRKIEEVRLIKVDLTPNPLSEIPHPYERQIRCTNSNGSTCKSSLCFSIALRCTRYSICDPVRDRRLRFLITN